MKEKTIGDRYLEIFSRIWQMEKELKEMSEEIKSLGKYVDENMRSDG